MQEEHCVQRYGRSPSHTKDVDLIYAGKYGAVYGHSEPSRLAMIQVDKHDKQMGKKTTQLGKLDEQN